jgi:hypothetical protein
MAKNNMFLGYARNALGDIVFTRIKTTEIQKARNRKPANPRSEGQVNTRERMIAAMEIAKSGKVLFQQANYRRPRNWSVINNIVHNLLMHSITGYYPAIDIDFEHLAMSVGDMDEVISAAATATTGKVTFNWALPVGSLSTKSTDYVVCALFNDTKKKWIGRYSNVSAGTLTQDVEVPANWKGDAVHAYMCAVATDLKNASPTTYLGTVSLP